MACINRYNMQFIDKALQPKIVVGISVPLSMLNPVGVARYDDILVNGYLSVVDEVIAREYQRNIDR